MNLVIIIPTFNNCCTLESVVKGCMRHCSNIIVVNDGSTDGTDKVLERFTSIMTIVFPLNRGKGAALKDAFRYAAMLGFDYAITIDSDGQHYPEEIPRFIEAASREKNTLWIGSRDLSSENMPQKSSFANKFSNFWFRAETGIKLTDTQSGFRLYPLKPFDGMKFISGRYEFELEAIVRAAWKGVPVKNMPVKVYYPPKNERISHFRPFRDFTRISILNTLFVLYALAWYWPFRFVKGFTRNNIRNFVNDNITNSKESNTKIAGAIGLGLFFGIVPLWGYQMVTAVLAAHFLKLNKLLVLVASNISIPPMIPFILYGSFATGAWLLGLPPDIIPVHLSLASIAGGLKTYLIGSIIFAMITAFAGFIISYSLLLVVRKPEK
ncbi:MAG: glycosyltransferase [Bacteroidetes bacterium GWF2_40_14]|nr:MAG: glycosyltransferase [Bacteroidetes bacterium GWF2_40_14]